MCRIVGKIIGKDAKFMIKTAEALQIIASKNKNADSFLDGKENLATDIKDTMLLTLVSICEEVKKLVQENGEIQVDHLFNIYGQCTGFYFATLYQYQDKNNPYYKDPELLVYMKKCWDYYISLVNEEGKTHILTFGQSWGYVYEEWNTLHLMNTVELLKDVLDKDTVNRYSQVVQRSCEGLARSIKEQFQCKSFQNDLKNHSVPNHFIWSLVCIYRYAVLSVQPKLQEECDRMMEDICKAQLPFGAFLEGGSLVVLYSHTTLGALALYSAYCGNKNATVYQAVLQNIDYLNKCYYQGIEIIGCFDSRNRDEKRGAFPHIPGAFLKDETCRMFASRHVSAYHKDNSDLIRIQQSLGFYCASFGTVDENSPLKLSSPEEQEVVYIDRMTPPLAEYSEEPFNTLKIQKKGFVIPICLLPNKAEDFRWYLQRQNLLSVYHLEKGLLMGGGHSHGMPEFSCFNVISNGRLEYLHTKGHFESPEHFDLWYHDTKCEIKILSITEKEITLRYAAQNLKETDRVLVNIPVPVSFYQQLQCGEKKLDLKQLQYSSEKLPAGTVISSEKCSFSLNHDCIFRYPVFAFDTYMQKQTPNRKNAFLILTVELDYLDSNAILYIFL